MPGCLTFVARLRDGLGPERADYNSMLSGPLLMSADLPQADISAHLAVGPLSANNRHRHSTSSLCFSLYVLRHGVRVSGGCLLRYRFECTLNAACTALISCVTLAAPAKKGRALIMRANHERTGEIRHGNGQLSQSRHVLGHRSRYSLPARF